MAYTDTIDTDYYSAVTRPEKKNTEAKHFCTVPNCLLSQASSSSLASLHTLIALRLYV